MIQIFDRYILKEFIKFMLGGVILFTGVGMISKILETLQLIREYNGESSTIWLYYLYNIPFTMSIVIAPSFLLSISYITSKLIQDKELLIICSSGRSIKRTILPILIFSFFFSFALLAFNEYISYPAMLQAYSKKNEMRGRSLDFHSWRNRYHLNIHSKNRIFFMNEFDPNKKSVHGLHIVEHNMKGNIQKIIQAEEASIKPHKWLLKQAEITYFKDSIFRKQRSYKRKEEDIPEDFTVFQHFNYGIEEANIFQLLKFIKIKKERGDDQTKFEVEFYWHFGFPFMCFFCILIGAVVTSKSPNGGFTYSLSISILCTAFYFLIMFYTKALGVSHTITPFWAGSIGNFIVGGTTLFLWFKWVD